MTRILVGIDGTERGSKALAWAARYGHREGAVLTLAAVVDPAIARMYGAAKESTDASIEHVLNAARESVLAKYPDAQIETKLLVGKVIDSLAEESANHDLIVVGSHHGASVGETVGGAKGLRISVSVDIPTVVVPCDWDFHNKNHRIVAGVGPDESSNSAVMFAVREALADGEQLDLVSGWGLPALLTKPAEAMGGGIGPVGEQFQQNLDHLAAELKEANPELDVVAHAVEGSSPTRAIMEYAKDSKLLVLGTHSRSTLGRTLFGSVTHSVLLNLCVPTVIVPKN